MTHSFKAIIVLAISALIVSCCPCRKSASKEFKPLIGTNWSMVQYGSNAFTPKEGYTITFNEGGKIAGKGDCNRLMGSFTNEDGKLTISQLAGTRMMCPNQKMESEFIEMLTNSNAFSIDGNLLSLIKDGEVVAIFEGTTLRARSEQTSTR